MKRPIFLLCFCMTLLFAKTACAQVVPMRWSDPWASALASTFTMIESENWQSGLSALQGIQSPSADNVTIVDDPLDTSQPAVQVYVRSDQNYSQVANGAVRAEMVFGNHLKFVQGKDYLLRWRTYIPPDYVFDPKLVMVITQIHQTALSGSPPMELDLNGGNYVVSMRGGPSVTTSKSICCAQQDQGRWVDWALRYMPDAGGVHASTQLWKDGVAVFGTQGFPNAYPGDNSAYLKMGIYLLSPFQTRNQITLLFGPVTVGQQ
ncbi:polysaccharide lyase [Paraburkholderia sp. D15]|uniref:heparin lyase I family protein n=1 Tax=Paraburkholderia sp. D15 TaxID=2880218 RepID=UPI002478CC19|nr:heparin lyase I family protein [Paraburkholderia sp. D15]WGS53973.1 polysaccharide lyase [Paraburkholderia sp. D15]